MVQIDGVWFNRHWQPSFVFNKGKLDYVEIIIRPNGGQAEIDWRTNRAPYQTSNPGEGVIIK